MPKKVSELDSATSTNDDDGIYIVQGGESKQIELDLLLSHVQGEHVGTVADEAAMLLLTNDDTNALGKPVGDFDKTWRNDTSSEWQYLGGGHSAVGNWRELGGGSAAPESVANIAALYALTPDVGSKYKLTDTGQVFEYLGDQATDQVSDNWQAEFTSPFISAVTAGLTLNQRNGMIDHIGGSFSFVTDESVALNAQPDSDELNGVKFTAKAGRSYAVEYLFVHPFSPTAGDLTMGNCGIDIEPWRTFEVATVPQNTFGGLQGFAGTINAISTSAWFLSSYGNNTFSQTGYGVSTYGGQGGLLKIVGVFTAPVDGDVVPTINCNSSGNTVPYADTIRVFVKVTRIE